MIRENKLSPASGALMLLLCLGLLVGGIWVLSLGKASTVVMFFGGLAMLLVGSVALIGLTIVNPSEGRVLTVFGSYTGTVREPGFWWVNPFANKRLISLRARSFESAKLKVNDHDGNPIEIAAVVVWKVVDTAEACFEVDNYEHYMTVQTEAAIRNLASHYPYDAHIEGEFSLRGSTDEVAARLKTEIQARLDKAGVRVIEARISHLAYAPEIASAMLRRQQAGAIIAARQRIVEGAVGMVEQALDLLQKSEKVKLDEERKAAMVSNLLVVLCADREAQPVVNTGSIY